MSALSYLRRRRIGTLQLFHSHSTNLRKSLRSFLRNAASFVPERVLIVGKLSRYHFEKLREPELDEMQLKTKLLERGSDYDSMVVGHNANKRAEEQVMQILDKMNVQYKLVDRSNITRATVAWADFILPIGGDGTFLLAANLIFNNKTPILGINSYPEKSEGFLMAPAQYTKDIPSIFESLKTGQYDILMRRRIRTTLKGEGIWEEPFHTHEEGRIVGAKRYFSNEKSVGNASDLPKERKLPWFALNEVFIAESLSARTSCLSIKINDNENYHKVRCSGLCISTGTGSTSWYKAINSVSSQTVQQLLHLIDSKRNFTDLEIDSICTNFNNSLHFHPEDDRLSYVIRDMIVSDLWPALKCVPPQDCCVKITVKSLCFDAGLVLDGGIAIHFNAGTEAVLEVYPEDSLRTIVLPKGSKTSFT